MDGYLQHSIIDNRTAVPISQGSMRSKRRLRHGRAIGAECPDFGIGTTNEPRDWSVHLPPAPLRHLPPFPGPEQKSHLSFTQLNSWMLSQWSWACDVETEEAPTEMVRQRVGTVKRQERMRKVKVLGRGDILLVYGGDRVWMLFVWGMG